MISLMRTAAGQKKKTFSVFGGVAELPVKIKIELEKLISLEGICATVSGFVVVPRSLVSFPREPHLSTHSGPWVLF